ncbi:MAG TPA: hypothetical protein VKB57_20725 [Acidimicrobiales bacterium]|nr:hypothetical protein [Acidimicrobiales bacterium]
MDLNVMTTLLAELWRRASRPRDDSGVADQALIVAGFVAAAVVLVGAVAAYVAKQIGVLGG